ncbi:hypothetical protein HPB50_024362 [Hyalomma asiaticum]|uniref:Uncharacterized protein n=1 Tax=Hyalomma asiaticum TaxID=266040 RepID=A0ACB7TMN4_HYAAI|nr:hypothetical protein HPB50_024362 [Hyalomma asiaticum]
METLKKKRNVIRSQATCFINDAGKFLNNRSAVDLKEVSALVERLRLIERQLKDIDRVATCIVRLEIRKNDGDS